MDIYVEDVANKVLSRKRSRVYHSVATKRLAYFMINSRQAYGREVNVEEILRNGRISVFTR
jgi:hypothetical protein